ncbi:nucleoside diphosphate-linked moiety X motif 13-like [Anneissia japonica]|uniref:nucleoside diphosphate-linked moiety X motif 13-like n=1 Tax=Anneissia japonica TaxID=1529436 RepID=UPI0014258E7F|nr:nucleoside diphosphate-linked moiety X motif 13-like [Anneissia japonica]XP_033101392.1 nucleoside diphosphate-linked moiety X motif 13-like [Anneissia japonica]
MLPPSMKLCQFLCQKTFLKPSSLPNLRRFQSACIRKARLIQSLKDNNKVNDELLQQARFAVFRNFKPLVAENSSGGYHIPWKGFCELSAILREQQPVLLTNDISATTDPTCSPESFSFAINIPSDGEQGTEKSIGDVTEFATEMRRAMFIISQEDTDILSQGYGLLKWHSMNSFCPNCGTKTVSDAVGSKRMCEECNQVNYPKMAPIVITLVMDGDRCLVVRQPTFPQGMFSALAGFCEIGETIEMSTRREVAEEVGLLVDNVHYQQSQHWPFPTSGLMIGCYATIIPGTAHQMSLDEKELEDARWMSREEVKSVLESNTRSKAGRSSIWFPPPGAIAHHLIKHWAFTK